MCGVEPDAGGVARGRLPRLKIKSAHPIDTPLCVCLYVGMPNVTLYLPLEQWEWLQKQPNKSELLRRLVARRMAAEKREAEAAKK